MTERFLYLPLSLFVIADSKINEDGRLFYFIKVYDIRKDRYKPSGLYYWWENYCSMKNKFQDIVFELRKTGTLKNFYW